MTKPEFSLFYSICKSCPSLDTLTWCFIKHIINFTSAMSEQRESQCNVITPTPDKKDTHKRWGFLKKLETSGIKVVTQLMHEIKYILSFLLKDIWSKFGTLRNLSQCPLLFFEIYIIDTQHERKSASAIMYTWCKLYCIIIY